MFANVLERLQIDYPSLDYTAAESFHWSPETGQVHYDQNRMDESGCWSLLHETGHALLAHQSYESDLDLLHMEVSAWEQARTIAPDLGVEIDDDYVQDCLDTYREWLYRRSVCPGCGTQCLQLDKSAFYRCYNCHTRWHVSPSRFCRAYRRAENKAGTKPLPVFALKHYK